MRISLYLYVVMASILSATTHTRATAEESLDDPIIQSIELSLDVANSSKNIISTLSAGGKYVPKVSPTMRVDLYQSGKRVMTGEGRLPAWSPDTSSTQSMEFMYVADVEK